MVEPINESSVKSWQLIRETRWFSNNKSRLLSRSHTFAITVNIRFENTLQYVDTVTFLSKTWTKGHWPQDDLRPQVCWGHMYDSTQGSLCQIPTKIHQNMCGYSDPFLQKLEPKVIDPRWTLIPCLLRSHVWMTLFFKNLNQRSLTPRWPLTSCLLRSQSCVTLPKDHCVQVLWEYINVCGYSDQFCKITTYCVLCTTYYVQNEWSHSLWVIT